MLSTLALVTTDREMDDIRARCGDEMMIEANDVAIDQDCSPARRIVSRPVHQHRSTRRRSTSSSRGGAVRVGLPVELSAAAIATLARHNPVETEALVFGRQPLSLSMRCYHARAYGLTKDSCQFVCELDPDGLAADQLDGKPLLVVNGTQTLSHGYAAAVRRTRAAAGGGRDAFPAVAADDRHGEGGRAVSRRARRPRSPRPRRRPRSRALVEPTPFVNGYMRGRAGMSFSGGAAQS